MPSRCCIPKCKNTTKLGFHLFRFPLNRPDILKKWINAIGRDDFKATKYHLICSAHFVDTDFMKRPNASGVRLKNLAVPSIFFETPAPTVNPICVDVSAIKTESIEFDTTPTSASAVMIETPSIKLETTPASTSAMVIETSSIKFDTTPAFASAVPPKAWKSILKPAKDNSTFLIPSSKTEPASTNATDTIKMSMRKPRKIMDNSLLKFKKQEMSPAKKLMWRTIKSLKQKLRRKEEKINSLKNLIKTLGYDNKL